VAEGELRPIYLITGGDRPKIRRALERLRARFGQESVETLAAESASGEEAVAACNSLGLFSGEGGRLVIVEGVEAWKKDDEEAVAGYVKDPVAGAVLVLVAGGDLKGSSLPALCKKAGEVLTYEVPRPRDLPSWVRAQFERLGVNADGEAARALVDVVGEDATALTTEAEKLAAWAGGDQIGRREVEQLAVPSTDASAWAIMDAWGGRNIVVNDELGELERMLKVTLPACLSSGGIVAMISFHSLEDRMVKNAFRDEEHWEQPLAKPIAPTPSEVRFNPRSRSAKVRIAKRR
jgi:DNA polymerase III delta subunit